MNREGQIIKHNTAKTKEALAVACHLVGEGEPADIGDAAGRRLLHLLVVGPDQICMDKKKTWVLDSLSLNEGRLEGRKIKEKGR